MSRSTQDILEFDQLRELLRLRATCPLGRRRLNELQPETDRKALEDAFAQIREANEWLRMGRELGFGGLSDPESWMARLESPGVVLEAKKFLDAGSLLETADWLRVQFREETAKFPLLAAQAGKLADFRELQAAIKRCILPNGDISDDASARLRRIRNSILQTRDAIQKASKRTINWCSLPRTKPRRSSAS
jgi:DNA mismatch repair protein MutS2